MGRKPAGALLAALLMAAPAHAQMVKAQDPATVLAAMEAGGFTASMGKDGEGAPMISSEHQGTKFKVLFYNCAGERNCATVQFHAGYDLEGATPLEKINAWNKSQRFGRAYVDGEGDPILQMDLDLDDGGLSRALFLDNLEFWTSLLAQFEKHIGYAE
jgi:hypothetical protein